MNLIRTVLRRLLDRDQEGHHRQEDRRQEVDGRQEVRAGQEDDGRQEVRAGQEDLDRRQEDRAGQEGLSPVTHRHSATAAQRCGGRVLFWCPGGSSGSVTLRACSRSSRT